MDVRALLNKKLPEVANRREHQASRLFRIETMDLTFSNGTKATYERICGGRGAVMAVPFDGTHFYLTVEYCGGTMNYGLGLVKGKIDAGETPEQAVVRELEEEIGFGTRKVQLLKHEMTVQEGDEPEPIDLVKLTVPELKELIFDPDSVLVEGRTVAALTLALHKIGALN